MSNTERFLLVEVARYSLVSPKCFYYTCRDTNVVKGSLVQVQFGKQNSLAVVKDILTTKPEVTYAIREIIGIIETPQALNGEFLQLIGWLKQYYSASSKNILTALLPAHLEQKSRVNLTKATAPKPELLHSLSTDQQNVLDTIAGSSPSSWLLRGITGSGKTEIYLHLIDKAMRENTDAIVLVPEILLSAQLAARIQSNFTNAIVTHSGLSPARRKALWLHMLDPDRPPTVIIGSRSAILSPSTRLGLIIIDEEHESSYKQDTGLSYDAVFVAAWRARHLQVPLILGSATPSIRTHFLVQNNKINLLELNTRHIGKMPKIAVVAPPKGESLLSDELVEAMKIRLSNNEQIMLILNRRGSARAQLCEDCGQSSVCPDCNISLVYHADLNKLRCHYCNYSTAPAARCKTCGSTKLRYIGSGTKKLETELNSLWPNSTIARLDSDNATWEYMQEIFTNMNSGKIQILVGTQMISRGLDFGAVTLVGIVDADSGLSVPDFTASEKTYSLLTQSSGRAGRSTDNGQVIIQTRNPSHPSIVAASTGSGQEFYESELRVRKQYSYPPYVYMVKLWYAHANNSKAEKAAKELFFVLKNQKEPQKNILALGPVRMLVSKRIRTHSWMIIVKSTRHSTLEKLAAHLPNGWKAELDPSTIL